MKSSIEQRIVNGLLDRLEKSSAYRSGTTSSRRILLKFYDGGITDFPEYDIEQTEVRIQINRAVTALARQGLIHFSWMRGEENHILAKVWLEPERLDEAYALCRRTPKKDILLQVSLDLLELEQVSTSSDWAREYCQDSLTVIEQKGRVPQIVPEDAQDRQDLFAVIKGLAGLGADEMTQRVFSVKILGDSKRFETNVRSRLVRVLRQYLEHDEDAREEDLLRQVGLVRYPEQFEFCGGLTWISGSQRVDFGGLKAGTSLSAEDLKTGSLELQPQSRRILSIENRANYFSYLRDSKRPEELVIYHGGVYSPARKLFFQAVCQAMSKNHPDSAQVEWLHWGDIDYGGFTMLARLRREINPGIQPYRMSLEELQRFETLAQTTTKEYAAKLQSLRERPELTDCKDCIEYLAAHRIRLEQENQLMDPME